ncbi:MAG: YoaK family protein [Gammaproteobacteria bacterium]
MISLLSADPSAERRLAVCLALIAGYVDAYTLLTAHIYVSFMSGNTTQTGSMIGQGRLLAALLTALTIACFVIGATAGAWITAGKLRNPRQLLFGAIATALAITIGVTFADTPGRFADACLLTLALAMGLMNATHSHVGAEPMSLTFVTGTLNRIGTHLALALRRAPLPGAQGPGDTHLRRAAAGASVWSGFLAGTIVSAAASTSIGVWALLPPLIALLALTLFSRSENAKTP